MGEEPGTARTSVATDAKDPERLREEIEATRLELGDTVEALAYKADVKSRMRDKIASAKASATQRLGKAREAPPDSVSSGGTHVALKAKENPVPLGVAGAFVGGFLLGRLTKRGAQGPK
jgi:hypothetical protein